MVRCGNSQCWPLDSKPGMGLGLSPALRGARFGGPFAFLRREDYQGRQGFARHPAKMIRS